MNQEQIDALERVHEALAGMTTAELLRYLSDQEFRDEVRRQASAIPAAETPEPVAGAGAEAGGAA